MTAAEYEAANKRYQRALIELREARNALAIRDDLAVTRA